ncbi:hypothetical protein BCR33DRAFT_715478 [Rhizoclosmatium globosum]|uniref:chitin synthase n=1 Tax=Rhizoclosmatium globosum TaxID=329046 RepID=A0A1Y2CH40_9FUNG|nr:hypothetical protein BCR33DRAFT_715478 [Rhizoclosmatium globosum]|eukprot:ORY46363.1 hypothetical protein BCR33DRAFT_715478 [Rhizoclosmatium globosum]
MKRKDLCIISATVCGIVLFLIIGLGRILCPLQKVLSQGEIDGMTDLNNPIVSMFGAYYQIRDIVKDHVDNQAFLSQAAMKQTVLGHDVSAMFYKTTVWSNYCKLPQPAGFDNVVRNIPKEGFKVWFPHQGNDGSTNKPIDYVQSVSYMRKGMVARDASWIQSFLSSDPINNRLIVAYGTSFNKFLGSNIGKIVDQLGASGVDATSFMEQVRKLEGHQKWSDYVGCMNGLFLTGVVDHRLDKQCLISNYIMLSASSILVLIIGLKFLTALQCTRRSNPENHDRFVLVQSVLMSSYLDTRKVLFVIADGMIVGSGNDKPTPKIVLDVLGWEGEEPEALLVQSLGDGMKQLNMAKVYSGYYAIQSKRMPYIVVSKVGTQGKRDSQLLIMKFLNRVHLDLEMNPMELELVRHFRYGLQIDPSWFEYILWIDADTEIYRDSINRLVACMIRDSRVVGVVWRNASGNEMESWVTMIQVYEYFISHHLSKQFESVFGSVTCLPGCFSMFRIRSSNKTAYLISNDVIQDRYLTTLMMKHFPGHKLAFSPDAKCKTQAPASWNVFVSQPCGCCLLSMRVVVFIDLFSTLAQPSALVYFGYLIYSSISDESHGAPLFSLIMIAAIYGVQLVIFMLKGEFQHLGWMVLYLLAIPIYSFYLPIYSFWHFDDFSWGNTRIVVDESGARVYEYAEENFDPSMIPLKKVRKQRNKVSPSNV